MKAPIRNQETAPAVSVAPGMGAIPHANGCTFRVWAPAAQAVCVAGSFNEWSKSSHPLAPEGNGYWAGDVENAKPGDEYRFVIRNGELEVMRVDPYAREVRHSNGNGIIHDPAFEWGEHHFELPKLNEMVIYEMHVGTFGMKPDGSPGDFHDAIARLDYLKELGVNAVQIMPVMEFAGGHSWGYNPAHIFAVETDYGGATGLRQFIKAAHESGLAVIMDVVYNHFGPSDLELWQFDGWSENGKGGIYFYNDWRAETPWGETRPDYGRPEVRQFIRDNALMWLEEYRVDGLRFDSVSHITNVYGRADDPASDLPEGWSLLQWLHEEIRARQPWTFTIAEDLRVSPSITKPVEEGGLGFNAQWDSPFLLAVREVISAIEDSHRNLDAVRDAVLRRYQDDAFRRVVYTESHDDVAEGDVRLPERLQPGDAGNWIAKKLSTLGAILVFTSPGIPMIFQGQEFLEDRWFEDQNPLDWSKTETHGGIFRLYRDLIRLRLNRDGQTRGLSGQGVEILHLNQETNVFGFKRTDQGGPGDTTLVFLNLSNNVYENYTVGLPEAGDWHVRFNSDSQLYDGQFANVGDQIVTAQIEPLDQLPCRAQITLAPYSALILSL